MAQLRASMLVLTALAESSRWREVFPSVLLACGRELTPSRSADRALSVAPRATWLLTTVVGAFSWWTSWPVTRGIELKVGLPFLFPFAYCLYRLKGRHRPLSVWVPV